MSAIRTFTVTVADPGSGNRYYIDDVLQDTINLAEGYTYVFNYPSAHPFRFSTTSDGTHNGGSEYTTGVTVNSSTQIEITVAASAPTLYYYCSFHPNMGGQANTVLSNTWGVLQWNQNQWGDQDDVTVSLTGLSATSSLGDVIPFNETGWGRDTWGFENWGESAIDVILPALTANTSLNTPTDFIKVKPGWGTLDWGENGWGTVESAVFNLTGLSATASLGSLTISDQAIGLTGLSSQTALGSLTVSGNHTLTLSGLSLQSSVGLLSVDDHSVGLSGLSATSAVGSLTPADVMGLTGLPATASVGSLQITSNPVTVLTGLSATSSVGGVSIGNETKTNLTGVSATSALGSLTTTQLTNASLISLGQTATTSLNDTGIILQYLNRLVPKDSTGYSRKTAKDSTGYTRKTAN